MAVSIEETEGILEPDESVVSTRYETQEIQHEHVAIMHFG